MASPHSEKIEKLRNMAAVLRRQAGETLSPEYRGKMERAARDLETEAERLERERTARRAVA